MNPHKAHVLLSTRGTQDESCSAHIGKSVAQHKSGRLGEALGTFASRSAQVGPSATRPSALACLLALSRSYECAHRVPGADVGARVEQQANRLEVRVGGGRVQRRAPRLQTRRRRTSREVVTTRRCLARGEILHPRPAAASPFSAKTCAPAEA